MLPALLLTALLAAKTPVTYPKTYLASITGIKLGPNEFVDEFSIDTWGVRHRAVCHFPPGWFINAGSSANPTGEIKGQATMGVTYLDRKRLSELNGLALITLDGPIQQKDAGHDGGPVFVPATFKGYVSIGHYGTDETKRKVRLTNRNIKLIPASRCPAPRD